jgi:peptidoglycan/LPS O-acetylase OafA/YrhL
LSINKPAITALHFTRFVAAFCVVAYHYGKAAIPFNSGLLNICIQNGGFAVSYFFALSGFIMMYAYYQPQGEINFKSFWLARFARIYPVYLLSFLLVLLAMYIFNNSKPKGMSIILQGLCLQAWKPGISMEINYVSWSIAVEALFYFCFPFLLKYWQKKSLFLIISQAVIFWLLSLVFHVWMAKYLSSPDRYNVGQFIAFFPPWHLNSFVLGSAIAILYIKVMQPANFSAFFSNTFIVGGLILIYVFFVQQPITMGFLTNGGIIPIFLILIIGIALNKGIIAKVFSLKPLVWLGEISYGFYLWQFLIYLFFTNCIPSYNGNLNSYQFYLYLILLMTLSGLSFHLFEVPMRNYIKSKFSRSSKS